MILIIGLGNPGKKYENTRHNIGFMAIDEIAANFESTDWQIIFNSQISKGKINGKNVILAKPQTFMNLSGKSVSKIAGFYKINSENIVIVHDDIDLPLEKIRIVKNRGTAGHRGVESIIKELGAKNFIRFRIGIKPKTGKPKNPEKFVLQKFTKEKEKIVKQTIKKTAEAIEFFLKNGLEKTQNRYNK